MNVELKHIYITHFYSDATIPYQVVKISAFVLSAQTRPYVDVDDLLKITRLRT